MAETFLTIKGVKDKTKFGTTKIYSLISKGQFPPPAKIGSASRWREADVDEWIRTNAQAARCAARV